MTLRLHYSPGASSLIPHILLEDAGAKFSTNRVDTKTGAQRTPEFLQLNPLGRVPVLEDNHRVITETSAIAWYLMSQFPAASIVRNSLVYEEVELMESLSYFSTVVQPLFAQIYRPSRISGDESYWPLLRAEAESKLPEVFLHIKQKIQQELALDGPSLLSVYVLTFYRWACRCGYVPDQPTCANVCKRLLKQTSVIRVLQREGLSVSEWNLS